MLRNQLLNKGVPEKELKGIEEYANSKMEQENEKIAQEIVNEYYKENDPHRKNELIIGVKISLNKIANRIDKGFNIEIRVEPLPPTNNNEQVSEEAKQNIQTINAIRERAKTLEFIKKSGPQILKLNESDKK
jgi:hypothetical protein